MSHSVAQTNCKGEVLSSQLYISGIRGGGGREHRHVSHVTSYLQGGTRFSFPSV